MGISNLQALKLQKIAQIIFFANNFLCLLKNNIEKLAYQG